MSKTIRVTYRLPPGWGGLSTHDSMSLLVLADAHEDRGEPVATLLRSIAKIIGHRERRNAYRLMDRPAVKGWQQAYARYGLGWQRVITKPYEVNPLIWKCAGRRRIPGSSMGLWQDNAGVWQCDGGEPTSTFRRAVWEVLVRSFRDYGKPKWVHRWAASWKHEDVSR